jgi:hypothetical protein
LQRLVGITQLGWRGPGYLLVAGALFVFFASVTANSGLYPGKVSTTPVSGRSASLLETGCEVIAGFCVLLALLLVVAQLYYAFRKR